MTHDDNQLYPITFSIGTCNIDPTPWEQQLLDSFEHNASLSGLLSAYVTLRLAQKICDAEDIKPYLGVTTRHRSGDSTFNVELAQERIHSLARAYSSFKHEEWTPIAEASIRVDGHAELIRVLDDVMDLDWNVQRELVNADIDQRFDFSKFLEPPCCGQSSTK